MLLLNALALLTVAGAGLAQFAINEPDWGFQSYLHENYTLDCNSSDFPVQPYNLVKWELPSGHMLTGDTDKYTLLDNMGQSVYRMHLTVHNVLESDAGVYVCHIFTSAAGIDKRGHLIRGLNLGGHKYRDPFDEYREDLIVAVIAAAILFVPLVTACFVYKFRFQTKEDRREKHQARDRRQFTANGAPEGELSHVHVQGKGQGQANPGYDLEGTRL